MLFQKKIQRHCAYCVFGGKIDEDSMICEKCGVVPAEHHCRRFRYDPLKRIPAKHRQEGFDRFKDTDFSL